MKQNKSFLDQLPPDEAARIRAMPLPPGYYHVTELYKKVGDGTATPEELMEYEQRMRRVRDLVGGEDGSKAYIDEC